jgi:two-component system, response regulator PdtaR
VTANWPQERGVHYRAAASASSSTHVDESNSASRRKRFILVVEDHSLIRMGAVDLVRHAGFDALEAGDADEAIRILESRTDISLVFTDVEMPGSVDGIKLAHYVRHRWPPVMLIVASGRHIVADNHLPEGAVYFQKPYNDNAIIQAMIGMLA